MGGMPGDFPGGCEITVLQGDPAKPNADALLRVPGGYEIPPHSHTSAERMILVSGTMTVDYQGHPAATLNAGDYAYGPAGTAAQGDLRVLASRACCSLPSNSRWTRRWRSIGAVARIAASAEQVRLSFLSPRLGSEIDAPISRPPADDPRRRRAAVGPHRHRDPDLVRRADALRPAEGLPAPHHQEAPPALDHRRAAVVPSRRHQHRAGSRSARSASGTNGRTRAATSAPSTASNGATGKPADGRHIDQIALPDRADQARPVVAAADRHRLESRRDRQDGAGAVPLPVPDPGRRRAAQPPALPAQRRHVSGRPVQHRQLFASDPHAGPRVRARARACSCGPAAIATFIPITWSRCGSS
jgi:hypothetical protein